MSERRRKSGDKRDGKDKDKAKSPPRPAPPPPPPKALVDLLKKNKAVLNYFTSLQENLDADVRKWKQRARHYQALYEEATTAGNKGTNNNNNGNDDENFKKKSASSGGKAKKRSTSTSHAKNQKSSKKNGVESKSPARKRQRKESEKDSAVKESNKTLKKAPPETGEDENVEENNGVPETIHVPQKQNQQKEQHQGKENEGEEAIDDTMFTFESDDEHEDDQGSDKVVEQQDRTDTTIKGDTNPHEDDDDNNRKFSNDQAVDDTMFEFLSDDDDDDSNSIGHDSDNKEATSSFLPKKKATPNQVSKTKPVDDAAFDVLSSDDEDDDDSHSDAPAKPRGFWEEHQQIIVSELLDAYRCLEHLGVALVEKQKIHSNDDTEQEPAEKIIQKTQEEEGAEEGLSFLPDESETTALKRKLAEKQDVETVVLERRSDKDVVADMLYRLWSLTRLEIQPGGLPSEYHSFRFPPLWIPCGDPVPQDKESSIENHPAYIGKICLFRALSVMDTICASDCLQFSGTTSMTDPWDELFASAHFDPSIDAATKQAMFVGMRDRHEMVQQLMESLMEEFSDSWAGREHSASIRQDSLYFKDQASDQEEDAIIVAGERLNALNNPKLLSAADTRSHTRLSHLAEQRILVQILVCLCLAREDPQEAFRFTCNYIISFAPSLELEDYPRVQPSLSLVVLEGLFTGDVELLAMSNKGKLPLEGGTKSRVYDSTKKSWFCLLLEIDGVPQHCSKPRELFSRTLSYIVHTTACIWQQRLQASDPRITDVARTEFACYLRLLENQRSWLCDDRVQFVPEKDFLGDKATSHLEIYQQKVERLVDGLTQKVVQSRTESTEVTRANEFESFALCLALTVIGEEEKVKQVFHSLTDSLSSAFCKPGEALASLCALIASCFKAFGHLQVRQLGDNIQKVGSSFVNKAQNFGDGDFTGDAASECYFALKRFMGSQMDNNGLEKSNKCVLDASHEICSLLLECCSSISNGEVAYEALNSFFMHHQSCSGESGRTDHGSCNRSKSTQRLINSIDKIANIPTVRVINLKRRRDRMIAMMSQAIHSGVIVIRGLVELEEIGGETKVSGRGGVDDPHEKETTYESSALFGDYAVDGKVGLQDIEERLFPNSEGHNSPQKGRVENFVAAKWRPSDLKAFDTKASNDENLLVRISDSERACALSHIATWTGVLRTLFESSDGKKILPFDNVSPVFQHKESVRRLFLHSGFARGKALDPHKSALPPAPVCVILEDDAIMVDAFVERLDRLLEELPRDFQFCSIGYSRPKTAPIVKYTSEVGIPTCLYYLTGYLLSLDGARYLLDNLPVVGPVDSWIGLQMVANWDNSFGERVGVGVESTPIVEGPSKTDLANILSFRAYVAIEPLCFQRVGGGIGANNTSGRKWRKKDSDITFSGAENYVG